MLGPNHVISLASNLVINGNPSALGVCLEAFFFSWIRTGSIPLMSRDGNSVFWECNRSISIFEHRAPTKQTCPVGTWLRPYAWNCPAFDAVFIRVEGTRNIVRFVQITRAAQHEMKLAHCGSFLNALRSMDVFDANEVEIFFVVPQTLMMNFTIPKITSPKCLSSRYGWPTSAAAVADRIGILGIDFSF